jgi:hypothetical protein
MVSIGPGIKLIPPDQMDFSRRTTLELPGYLFLPGRLSDRHELTALFIALVHAARPELALELRARNHVQGCRG